MEIKGRIEDVRPNSFPSRDGKTMIHMVYVDIYDKTAKLCECEMRQEGYELAEEMKIVAEVGKPKPSKFQGGAVIFPLTKILSLQTVDGKPVVKKEEVPAGAAAGFQTVPAAPAPGTRSPVGGPAGSPK